MSIDNVRLEEKPQGYGYPQQLGVGQDNPGYPQQQGYPQHQGYPQQQGYAQGPGAYYGGQNNPGGPTTVVVQNQSAPRREATPAGYWVIFAFSLVTCICCCSPFSLIALILSSIGVSSYPTNKNQGRTLSFVALGFLVASLIAIVVVAILIGVYSSIWFTTASSYYYNSNDNNDYYGSNSWYSG